MKKIVNGSIIEIYVKNIDRYIYLKYIDERLFGENIKYPFQFKTHGIFFKKPVASHHELDFANLLFSPLHLSGFDGFIKNGDWKIIGEQNISYHDQLFHHYKLAWPPNLIASFNEVKEWRVLKNINNVNEGIIVPYYRCAHLEYAENLGAGHLLMRVLIEYYKLAAEGSDIDKSKWDNFDFVLYSRYVNMPLYKDVPEEFKGKVLPKDYPDSPGWLRTFLQLV